MPWHWKNGDRLVCTGPCASTGWVSCPVNHDTAPDNDTWGGVPFFRCDQCDWVRPDDFDENRSEFAGKIRCPECWEGDRADTYNGPCDFCSKKRRPAAQRTFPEPLHDLARRKFADRITLWSCPHCFTAFTLELERAHQQITESQAWVAAHGHKPAGTCDSCKKIDYLDVVGPDWYICARCSPTWLAQLAGQSDPEPSAGPAPGWYEDPEHEGYLRWWSGHEWAGPPTLPEHCTN